MHKNKVWGKYNGNRWRWQLWPQQTRNVYRRILFVPCPCIIIIVLSSPTFWIIYRADGVACDVVAIFAASRRKRGIEYACDNRQSEGEGKGTSDSLNTVWKVVRRWGRGILVKWSMGLSSMLEDTLFAYPPLHNGRRYTVKMIVF